MHFVVQTPCVVLPHVYLGVLSQRDGTQIAKEIPCDVFVHARLRPWPFEAKGSVLCGCLSFYRVCAHYYKHGRPTA